LKSYAALALEYATGAQMNMFDEITGSKKFSIDTKPNLKIS
jgi:hypothetical protein